MSDKCAHTENNKKCKKVAKYYSTNSWYKSCETHQKDNMIKIGYCSTDGCDKKAYYATSLTSNPTKCRKHKDDDLNGWSKRVHCKPKTCQYTENCLNPVSRRHKINGYSVFCKDHHDFVQGRMSGAFYEHIKSRY
jgi:hypothetical protein